jgi:hypothetical protein
MIFQQMNFELYLWFNFALLLAARFTMVEVRDAISDVLDRMTIAEIVTPIVSGRSAASGRKWR